MFKSRWRTLLVLLAVALIALISGLFIRGLMLNDFQRHIEGDRLALVRMVSVDLENTYGKSRTWSREQTAEDVLRAFMLGLQMKVVDGRGEMVMNTEGAIALLPPARKARVLADTGFRKDDTDGDYHSYPLMLGEERVGGLDVKFLKAEGSDNAWTRSSLVVLAWSFLASGSALALGFLIARKPATFVGKPRQVAAAGQRAELNADMPVSVRDAAADVPGTPDAVVIADDALDADEEDDEDMQPLAGDPDRITRIVEGLNNLAKARTLGRVLQKQSVELAPFLSTLIEKTRESVFDKEVIFNLECRSGLFLSADPDCLTGILTNLMDNAAKAVKNSGTVTVSAEAKGDHFLFTVKDTGTGIRRKDVPHLFEQYYRASGSGIGLGLTIVKELVDACGGSIDIQTTRGKGSVFIVSVPNS